MIYIYGLRCPVDGGIRYVGKTINAKTRLRFHLSDAKAGKYKHYAANWIRGLLARGLSPELIVLEECSENNWQQAERDWIAKGKALGWRLTNLTTGGEGTPELSEESKASKSKKMKRAWQDAKYRGRIVAARNEEQFLREQAQRLKGRWEDDSHRQKMQDSRWTVEAKAKQADAIRSRQAKIQAERTPEVRAKQAASLKETWARRKAAVGGVL